VTNLIDQNIKSFNNLAFAVCGQPGQLDDARFRQLADAAFTHPSLGLESMLRQLSYEAITVQLPRSGNVLIHLWKASFVNTFAQERDERAKRLAAKIAGFSIQGEYEPAHVVVDFFTTMLEEGAPKYLPLSKCISREQELQSQRHDRRIVVLEDQQLQVKHKAPDLSADLSTDLKVQNAFSRRGLACEQAGLLTHDTHEKLRHEFMSHMMRTPPSNFQAPDISAVLDTHLVANTIPGRTASIGVGSWHLRIGVECEQAPRTEPLPKPPHSHDLLGKKQNREFKLEQGIAVCGRQL